MPIPRLSTLFAPAALPETLTVEGPAGPIAVRLRRNPRARRYSLRISPADAVAILTVPGRGTLATARRFLGEHVGWAAARLGELPTRTPFVDGVSVPIRGVPHRICAVGGRGLPRLENGDEGPQLVVPGPPVHCARRVRDHLVRLCRDDLDAAVRRHASTLGVRPTALRLKDTKGRWGSASTRGTLSFSWRLILAPQFVLDYLAAHEVAHLREMNHGPAFWALVDALCPRTEEARLWLKRHGADLHAYG